MVWLIILLLFSLLFLLWVVYGLMTGGIEMREV